MKYADEDLELAQHWSALHAYDHPDVLAELLTRVRRETREATIRECVALFYEPFGGEIFPREVRHMILTLLNPPSASAAQPFKNNEPEVKVNAEPTCKVCGWEQTNHAQLFGHDFQPEEPGHG